MDIELNYWAILLSVLATIVIGSLWYGPLFGKQWMRIVGIEKPEHFTKAMKNAMLRSYAIQTLASLAMVFVLANVLFFVREEFGAEGAIAGITAAIWMWLGFVLPVSLGPVLWENRPWKYWFITAGYYLVTLSVVGVILAVWR